MYIHPSNPPDMYPSIGTIPRPIGQNFPAKVALLWDIFDADEHREGVGGK